MINDKKTKGFTLVEIIVSIGVIAFLAGISVSVYKVFQEKNDLNIAVNTVVQGVRRAQMLAQGSKGDANWGIKIESGRTIIFKGADYVSRNIASDKILSISTRIIPSGLTEIVFAKFLGLPQTAGTIVLSNQNETKNITINEKGAVEY